MDKKRYKDKNHYLVSKIFIKNISDFIIKLEYIRSQMLPSCCLYREHDCMINDKY